MHFNKIKAIKLKMTIYKVIKLNKNKFKIKASSLKKIFIYFSLLLCRI